VKCDCACSMPCGTAVQNQSMYLTCPRNGWSAPVLRAEHLLLIACAHARLCAHALLSTGSSMVTTVVWRLHRVPLVAYACGLVRVRPDFLTQYSLSAAAMHFQQRLAERSKGEVHAVTTMD
jgi:hypothetical protein